MNAPGGIRIFEKHLGTYYAWSLATLIKHFIEHQITQKISLIIKNLVGMTKILKLIMFNVKKTKLLSILMKIK